MDAIITAGGRISGEFAEQTGVTVKALLEIGGKPVIRTVLEALRGLPEIGRIIVVGPDEVGSSAAVDIADDFVPETEDGVLNLMLGLERCSSAERALYSTSDLPFITTDAVQRYLGMCSPGADFYYPILRKEQFIAAFPDSQIEYARLEDGYYTGGCVFLLSPRPLLANRPLIERVFSSRKSLIKLASLLGWRFVVKMLSRRLSVDDCVRRGSQIIGCDCRVVVDSPPEIALDLDNISDYNFAVLHAGRLNA